MFSWITVIGFVAIACVMLGIAVVLIVYKFDSLDFKRNGKDITLHLEKGGENK
jgi:hypothetical protein